MVWTRSAVALSGGNAMPAASVVVSLLVAALKQWEER